MTTSDPEFFNKLDYYYVEFLSRGSNYKTWLKVHHEMVSELAPIQILPAKISPGKKRKAIRPEEIKKPAMFPSGSYNGQIAWDITHKFRCDSNRVILEINLENPIERISEQLQNIISRVQEDHWKKQEDENCFGEYRYLVDFRRKMNGKKIDKRQYLFSHWDDYIKAFDHFMQIEEKGEKGKLKKLAKELFDDDSADAQVKAFQHVEKARLLIKAAEENKFPPPLMKTKKTPVQESAEQK